MGTAPTDLIKIAKEVLLTEITKAHGAISDRLTQLYGKNGVNMIQAMVDGQGDPQLIWAVYRCRLASKLLEKYNSGLDIVDVQVFRSAMIDINVGAGMDIDQTLIIATALYAQFHTTMKGY